MVIVTLVWINESYVLSCLIYLDLAATIPPAMPGCCTSWPQCCKLLKQRFLSFKSLVPREIRKRHAQIMTIILGHYIFALRNLYSLALSYITFYLTLVLIKKYTICVSLHVSLHGNIVFNTRCSNLLHSRLFRNSFLPSSCASSVFCHPHSLLRGEICRKDGALWLQQWEHHAAKECQQQKNRSIYIILKAQNIPIY